MASYPIGEGMGDCICRIEALKNGFEVQLLDREIEKENRKPKGGYRDPWVGYAFETEEAVLKFLKANLKKVSDTSSFSNAFDAAIKEDKK